ncbi:MAG: SDR family oxidoreductase [Phycisphaerae bacterium]|nr:SDR family oxidoreductase [Phycisphaerae bacterium]
MDRRLKGKVAIVTGAATGIGEAIAHKFAKEGARVVVNGLETDPVDDVVEAMHKHQAEAVGYKGDVADEEHARRCVQRAIDEFGRLDVLVNNAGTFQTVADVDDFPAEDFDYMTRMNVRSVFLMTRYAMPHLQKTRGVVLATGSEAGLLGQPRCAPYAGSKAWIHAFVRSIALEQARHGVRANCVCPGPTETQWHDTDVSPMTDSMEADILKATPLGRRATAEEVANVFAFLASDEASFVTGALWFVDGGISISRGPVGDEVPEELRHQPEMHLHDLHHTHEGLEGKRVRTIE